MVKNNTKKCLNLLRKCFLSLCEKLATKCISLNNEPNVAGSTRFDLNSILLIELLYYLFMASLDEC